MPFLRTLLFSLLLLPLGLVAAPGPVKKGAVTAELIAGRASIQPGQAFHVALKLNHQEHWHSYWINPGTGYPTSLEWQLPDGFTAGPILWPTPHVVKDRRGTITGNGYENEVLLFVELKAPASLKPGETVTLRAKAEWLMCEDVCMPGDAALELALPVKAEAPAENMATARRFNNAFSSLPKPLAGWDVSAARNGDQLAVRVRPAAGNTFKPEGLHVFDNHGLVDYAAPQTVTEENGGYLLTLKVSKDAPADLTKLAGVLVARNGWSPTWGSDGALFEATLGAPTTTATTSSPTPQASGSGSQPSALSSQPPAAGGLLGTLFLAFVGGLILNLMPCVFPVLGIKILGFVNQAGSERGKVVAHGLVFTAGVLLSFWVLAGLLLVLRAGGSELRWGFQLQEPGFVFGMAVFLLVFSLNLSGLFEIGLAATGIGGKLQAKDGYAGSFFTGALAVLVATPCSAPFLASALGAALAVPPFQSMLLFTAIALGLALPYLLLSAFPQAVKLLPRPGAWMETFKQFMAFPLYATVGALLWVLAAQTADSDYALLFIMFGLLLVAMAAWFYGRFGQSHGKPGRQRFGLAAALILAVAGCWLGWPKRAPAPVPQAQAAGYKVEWEKWSPEAVAAARADNRTIYVDFTARWCATCQTNKLAVFSSDAVLAELEKRNVLLLKADWTSRDAKITAELAKWGKAAVPFNLIYAPSLKEPMELPELLTPGTVLEALGKTGS